MSITQLRTLVYVCVLDYHCSKSQSLEWIICSVVPVYSNTIPPHSHIVVNVSFRQPIYMFSENAGNGTVCVDKIGDTTQNISVMVSGRKSTIDRWQTITVCLMLYLKPLVCRWGKKFWEYCSLSLEQTSGWCNTYLWRLKWLTSHYAIQIIYYWAIIIRTRISIILPTPSALQAETGERIDQTVTFTPDQTEVCLTFNIVDDDIALEETEMFSWSLTLPGDDPLVRLGENPNTDILILDDDGEWVEGCAPYRIVWEHLFECLQKLWSYDIICTHTHSTDTHCEQGWKHFWECHNCGDLPHIQQPNCQKYRSKQSQPRRNGP